MSKKKQHGLIWYFLMTELMYGLYFISLFLTENISPFMAFGFYSIMIIQLLGIALLVKSNTVCNCNKKRRKNITIPAESFK